MNRRGLKSALVLMAIILVSIVLFNEIGNTIAATWTFYGGASFAKFMFLATGLSLVIQNMGELTTSHSSAYDVSTGKLKANPAEESLADSTAVASPHGPWPPPPDYERLLETLEDIIQGEIENICYQAMQEYIREQVRTGRCSPELEKYVDLSALIWASADLMEVYDCLKSLSKPQEVEDVYSDMLNNVYTLHGASDAVLSCLNHGVSVKSKNNVQTVMKDLESLGHDADNIADQCADRAARMWEARYRALRYNLGLIINGITQLAVKVYIPYIDTSHWPQVTASVVVTDAKGRGVFALSGSNFRVWDTGIPVADVSISNAINLDEPINVVLVMDCSSSMEGEPLEGAKIAASTFLQALNTQTKVALLPFSSAKNLTGTPFTNSTSFLQAQIKSLEASGDTNLYDAVHEAINKINSMEGRKVVVVLADGADNCSSAAAEEVIQLALKCETSIYSLGLVSRAFQPENLQELATVTGGVYLDGTSSELEGLYSEVHRLIQAEYLLQYNAYHMKQSDRWLKVEVNVGEITAENEQPYWVSGE